MTVTLFFMLTLASGHVSVLQTDTDSYLECRVLGDQVIRMMSKRNDYRDLQYKCVVDPGTSSSPMTKATA